MERDLTQDLTKQYASLFERKDIRKVFTFFQDIYRSGKLREMTSFAVWEVMHRLGLFSKQDYLSFANHDAILLAEQDQSVEALDQEVAQFFVARGLRADRSAQNWKLLFTAPDATLFGSIYPNDFDLYRSEDGGDQVAFVHHFPEQIKSIFVSSRGDLLVAVRGSVYHSADHGATFEKVLDLGSPISFPRHNNAITETPDGSLYMGEYGNIFDKKGWRKLAFLYASTDGGKTWRKSDFLIAKGANKHVHIVQYNQVLNRLLVADGDNYKRLWISGPLNTFRFESPDFTATNRFHIQMGGYTAIAESDGKVIFGTDYQGGTNFLVETVDGKSFKKKIIPDPFRRSPIDNMLVRKSARGEEIWANLPYSTPHSKCLLMVSLDSGRSWEKVFEYNRSTHTLWLVSASARPSRTIYISVESADNHERVVYRITDQC
jgi:hypothetical protein